MDSSTYQYALYIRTSAEDLWRALTDGQMTTKYFFGRRIQSEWEPGARVEFYRPNGDLDVYGEVVEVKVNTLLMYTWNVPGMEDRTTRVSFSIQPLDETTIKLSLTHEWLRSEDWFPEDEGFFGYNNGWPAILSNLKTLLETGTPLTAIVAE